MAIFKRLLFLSSSLFVFHIIYVFIWSLYKSSFDVTISIYSAFGIGVYIIVYSFWAYFLFSFIFIFFSKRTSNFYWKIIVSVILMIAAYTLSRTGDIIDGDFFHKFDFSPFIAFMLSSIILLVADNLFLKMKK